MWKKILAGVAIALIGFLGFVATRPDKYHVERSQKVSAPASVVFPHLDDLKAWSSWSPWDKLDPAMKKTFEGPAKGVGSSYTWQGNSDVGTGKMSITESQPISKVAYRIEFIEPFTSTAMTNISLKPEGENAVTVTWAMDGDNNFAGKLFGLFMNMDQAIGGDFEKGLANLKSTTEAQAKSAGAQAPAQGGANAAPTAAEAPR
jgi:hypothetical protein